MTYHPAYARVAADFEVVRQVLAMTTFPIVEAFRAELRARDYPRLTDAEAGAMRADYAQGMANNAIEDIHPPPAMVAFIDMLVEERVPQEVSDEYFDRFAADQYAPKRGPAEME